jgi:hypothetical protein
LLALLHIFSIRKKITRTVPKKVVEALEVVDFDFSIGNLVNLFNSGVNFDTEGEGMNGTTAEERTRLCNQPLMSQTKIIQLITNTLNPDEFACDRDEFTNSIVQNARNHGGLSSQMGRLCSGAYPMDNMYDLCPCVNASTDALVEEAGGRNCTVPAVKQMLGNVIHVCALPKEVSELGTYYQGACTNTIQLYTVDVIRSKVDCAEACECTKDCSAFRLHETQLNGEWLQSCTLLSTDTACKSSQMTTGADYYRMNGPTTEDKLSDPYPAKCIMLSYRAPNAAGYILFANHTKVSLTCDDSEMPSTTAGMAAEMSASMTVARCTEYCESTVGCAGFTVSDTNKCAIRSGVCENAENVGTPISNAATKGNRLNFYMRKDGFVMDKDGAGSRNDGSKVEDTKGVGGTIAAVVITLLVIICCVGYAAFYYTKSKNPSKFAKQKFEQTCDHDKKKRTSTEFSNPLADMESITI